MNETVAATKGKRRKRKKIELSRQKNHGMENAVWLTAVQPLANDCLHANEKKSKKL